MKTRKQKGKGIFQNVLNLFSGRKTARRKAMRSAQLSNANKERKTKLKKKWFKTKKNKQELSRLTAKLSTPNQRVYESEKQAALQNRKRVQKFFNRFYKKQTIPTPTPLEEMPTEGLVNYPKQERKPFNRKEAKQPNATFPEPPVVRTVQVREVNGEIIELAGQATVNYINAPILYALWKREAPKARLEDIPDADFDTFVQAIREKDMNLDAIARDVFHLPGEDALAELRLALEEGAGWPDRFAVVNFAYRFDDGTRIEKRLVKIPASVTPARFMGDIVNKGKKGILNAVEIDLITCPDATSMEMRKPLTTLKSNDCLFITSSKEYLNMIADATPTSAESNWISLQKKYLKVAQGIPIVAKYLKSARFIQEAFDNWGIEAIDPALFELFQIKYPELAIKMSTYFLSTKDFAYQARKLTAFENFLVIDKSIYSEEIGLTTLNPFESTSRFYAILEEAEEKDKLYGMSPYMAFIMKKIALPFWKRAFLSPGATENLRIYEMLTRPEQITIDFLQYLHFKSELIESTYNFRVARSTYVQPIGEGSLTEGMIQKLVGLYMSEYAINKRQLQFYQSIVVRLYEKEEVVDKSSRHHIEELLLKFKRPSAIRIPPNNNNNNNYSSLETINLSSPRPVPVPRFSEPVREERVATVPAQMNRRRRVALMSRAPGAFEQASTAENTNQTRRIALQRLRELNTWIAEKEPIYKEALRRYGNETRLKPKYNFVTRKLKYMKGNQSRLNSGNRNVIESYGILKLMEKAQAERAAFLSKLQRVGYPPLPASLNTMGETNTNID